MFAWKQNALNIKKIKRYINIPIFISFFGFHLLRFDTKNEVKISVEI